MANRVGKFATTLLAGLFLVLSVVELASQVASWEIVYGGGTSLYTAPFYFWLGIAIICIVALSIVVSWNG